jgi:hypothetical protein
MRRCPRGAMGQSPLHNLHVFAYASIAWSPCAPRSPPSGQTPATQNHPRNGRLRSRAPARPQVLSVAPHDLAERLVALKQLLPWHDVAAMIELHPRLLGCEAGFVQTEMKRRLDLLVAGMPGANLSAMVQVKAAARAGGGAAGSVAGRLGRRGAQAGCAGVGQKCLPLSSGALQLQNASHTGHMPFCTIVHGRADNPHNSPTLMHLAGSQPHAHMNTHVQTTSTCARSLTHSHMHACTHASQHTHTHARARARRHTHTHTPVHACPHNTRTRTQHTFAHAHHHRSTPGCC